MKIKKTLLLIAPAMLLASCNPSKATTISKIDLTNAKTLIMGKLSNSSVTTNEEDEEQLISVDEDGNATETEVEVTTGNTTTTTTNITISRLVKLNKEYAVVSCTYNDVTYDLIVNLTDGTCVKFPDSSLLPNSKEKLGGHRKYRKYIKNYGYLNKNIVQPNEEANIFYYVNHYQCDASDTTTYARRLVVLDLTGETPSAKAIVTPENKHSIQSFAVDSNGNVVYVASDTEQINNDTVFDEPKMHYDDSKEDVCVTIKDESNYKKIANYLISGNDGLIYCYLVDSNSKYYVATIEINTSVDPATAVASPVETTTPTEVNEPDKIFTIKNNNSVNIVSTNKSIGNKINQLLSFGVKNTSFSNKSSFNIEKPGPNPGPTPWGRRDAKPSKDESINDASGKDLTLSSIENGYSGDNYSYLFGSTSSNKKGFRKVQLMSNGSYVYIESILNEYFKNASTNADVDEVETDDDSEDITVVVEDKDEQTVYVVDDDLEKEVEEITEVSDVVDVAA